MDECAPIPNEANEEIINLAIDFVSDFHLGANRDPFLYCEVRPNDLSLFLAHNQIKVYMKFEEEGPEYIYCVVYSQRSGEYQIISDPFV
ncbi:MAG TPA: hypothetical protein PLV59_00935 [Candidatus Dojkabacteria bacterium]|nr:hypothetical protein [Candidatus Dojkabacteria bacterium]